MAIANPLGGLVHGESATPRILRAALSVTAAGILVKCVAASKEIAVAAVYGRTDAMDAFLAAALLPGLLINLVSESMNQALVPTLIRVRIQQGKPQAQQLLSNSMAAMCLLLAAVSLAMAFAAHAVFPLMASHFSPAKLALTIQLFYALLPVVLISGIAGNCTAILNAFEHFTFPALAQAVIPLAGMAGAILLGGRLGIWALVYATLAGALLHAALIGWNLLSNGFDFRPHWHGMTAEMREVAGQYGPVLLSGVVASGGLLVDQSMAAMLPAGSVSALVYANRFVSVLITLLAGAVSTVLTPFFSRMIALRNWAECRRTMRNWVGIIAAASAPLAALMVGGSHSLVRIAFERGAFGPRDTDLVASVLAMSAIQIPFFVCSRVFYRFLISMRRTDLALYCGLLNLVLDIGLNLVLMRWMGVAGIALATSLWSVSTFLFLWYWSRKLLVKAESHG